MSNLSTQLTDRSHPLHIHLIGVAGSGMSGLALLLLGMGHKVSGCDRVTTSETDRMQGLGLLFSCPQTKDSGAGADLVVYSSAIRPGNPAYDAAVKAGVTMIRRAECLAAILHTKAGIVISGTHGKTTTSSMTAHILRECGQKPSYYVGAEIPILGANARWEEEGRSMVAEGDESDGTLALYRPEHSVILNIEAEHLDFYRDLDHIKEVFTKLADQTTGSIVYCAEDPVAREICSPRPNSLSYGWESSSEKTNYTPASTTSSTHSPQSLSRINAARSSPSSPAPSLPSPVPSAVSKRNISPPLAASSMTTATTPPSSPPRSRPRAR